MRRVAKTLIRIKNKTCQSADEPSCRVNGQLGTMGGKLDSTAMYSTKIVTTEILQKLNLIAGNQLLAREVYREK